MNLAFLLALASLALWVVLAFVLAIPSGWVHVPLAVGAVLIAIGIVEADQRRRDAQISQLDHKTAPPSKTGST